MTSTPPPPTDPKDLGDWLGLTDAPNWRVARPLGIAVSVLLFVLFTLALVAAVAVMFHTIKLAANGSGEGVNLGAGALVAALLSAPFVIWSTVIKHRALGFQKEGHLTDRISAAVEQLGTEKTVKVGGVESSKPNIEVRIGGILSLERISQDSCAYDKGRDHVRVMEILTAYIRENAPDSTAQTPPELGDDPADAAALRDWTYALPPTRADIALALRVIGRRDATQRRVESRWGKDAAPDAEWVYDTPCPTLPDNATPAQQASFAVDLKTWRTGTRSYRGYRMDLRATNLQKADLSDLFLSGADLRAAQMQGANLHAAQMQGAILHTAQVQGANLRAAQMQGAILHTAQMQGANLSEAQMQGAYVFVAQMQGAYLFKAQMQGADLFKAQMQGADLSEAQMQGASLFGAQMQGADLRRTNLTDARGLTTAQLAAAFGDGTVPLPSGLDRPPTWPKSALEYAAYHTELQKFRDSPATYTPPA